VPPGIVFVDCGSWLETGLDALPSAVTWRYTRGSAIDVTRGLGCGWDDDDDEEECLTGPVTTMRRMNLAD
jgi:hypothetical protein